MSQTVFIYALECPDGGGIRYIGKANNPAARLKSHFRDARSPNRRRTPVHCWLIKLSADGRAPVLRILAEVAPADWPAAETALIAQHRASGSRLLNVAEGGNAPACSTETRAENGRKIARAIHDDPVRRRKWEVRKMLGSDLAWMRKRQAVSPEPYRAVIIDKVSRAIALLDAGVVRL